MKFAILLLVLLFIASPTFAQQSSMDTATQAAAGGDYRAAIQAYEQVLKQKGFSAPVLFDLGNAWLHLGNPAHAILEYERALLLAPRSTAVAVNLAEARQRAGVMSAPIGPWLAATLYFSFDTYVWAGLIALWVLCASIVALYLGRAARRIARALILLAAVTLCVSADAAVLRWPELNHAIALAPAPLHVAPAASAGTTGALREGESVWLQDRYAGFVFLRTVDGRSGWVSADAAVPVRGPPL